MKSKTYYAMAISQGKRMGLLFFTGILFQSCLCTFLVNIIIILPQVHVHVGLAYTCICKLEFTN